MELYRYLIDNNTVEVKREETYSVRKNAAIEKMYARVDFAIRKPRCAKNKYLMVETKVDRCRGACLGGMAKDYKKYIV
ncbi:hypothetical protein K9F62_02220 [Desulfovibrio sp. JY]|nr:hypothetical protein K9F62_02220 [Desulfovibrio sp. JY]